MMNNNLIKANHSQCNQVETQNHIVKYNETKDPRKEFIRDLVVELVKVKLRDVSVGLVMFFLESIFSHVENEEHEEHETN